MVPQPTSESSSSVHVEYKANLFAFKPVQPDVPLGQNDKNAHVAIPPQLLLHAFRSVTPDDPK